MQKDYKHELKSELLIQFIYEIQYKNRNPQNTEALELLKDKETNPSYTIPSNTNLYRCRIVTNLSELKSQPPFYGYDEEKSFIAPKESTKDMRANYRYIPYLYCSNDSYLSLIETRPRLGSIASIATITTIHKLHLLDFTLQSNTSIMSACKIDLFKDLSYLFSKPVTEEDDTLDYIPTQFIAEFAKNLGYDGIMFKSSLTPEMNNSTPNKYNLVVFNYTKCKAIKSNLVKVTNNYVDCIKYDSDTEQLITKNHIERLLGEI